MEASCMVKRWRLAAAAETNHESRAGSPPPESATPSPRRAGPGEHDLLTCGQCQTNFPLGDILVFIEHKRRSCRGAGVGPRSFSKPGENGGPLSARARSLDLGRGPVPVEVGIQTTPGGEGHEERRLTPAKGLCPKQERGAPPHSPGRAGVGCPGFALSKVGLPETCRDEEGGRRKFQGAC
ncbi:unnamed protein product [Arctogadus glacialis]